MERQYKTVVQGEASESDDDEEEEQEELQSVVVEGEASESEEEIDTSINSASTEIPHLKLNEQAASFDSISDITIIPTLSPKQAGRPKYDNVLNRKLWESNLSLCNNMNGMVSQAYLSAAKEIANCCQHLSRSHASIQDVSHNMRLITNDCFNLQDIFDTVTSCTLLPDIILPRKSSPQAATLSEHSSTSAVAASSTSVDVLAVAASSTSVDKLAVAASENA